MSEQLFKRLEKFRKQEGLSILALCRKMQAHNVTYHRWKNAKKITGPYKKIVENFLNNNDAWKDSFEHIKKYFIQVIKRFNQFKIPLDFTSRTGVLSGTISVGTGFA